MPKQAILVIEDEEEIQELVRFNLAKEGYPVSCVDSGEQALRSVRRQVPDLVVLDLMLPGLDGIEICKAMKDDPATRDIPIVMLTAKSEEADIVAGLELGADDYVTKPFSPRVLVARVKAVLRRRARGPVSEGAVLRIHNLVIHPGRHEVLVGGEPAHLSSTEFRVLHVLARQPGWVLSRRQIAEAVHGASYPVTDRSVDVQIVALRKKLCGAGRYIETVRGVGYRFKE